MKIKELYNKLEEFAKKLGDENLTVSIALCDGRYYISVSCHSSRKFEFEHGRLQQTAELKETHDGWEDDIDTVLNELVDKYKEILVPRESKKETLEDAIKRAKAVSSSSS